MSVQVTQGLGQTVAPAEAGQLGQAGEECGPAVGGDGPHPGEAQPRQTPQATQQGRGLVSHLEASRGSGEAIILSECLMQCLEDKDFETHL